MPSTHPDIVSLVDPLFTFGGKRVVGNNKPSFPLAEERVVERSNDRVSRRRGDNQLIIRSRNMLFRLAALAVETVINYQYQIVFRTGTG